MKHAVLLLLALFPQIANASEEAAAPQQQESAEQATLAAGCESIVLDSTQPEPRRLKYAVRWLHVATLRATTAPVEKRSERWQEVAKIAALADRELRELPDYFLVQIQHGLALIEQGKQLGQTPTPPSEHETKIEAVQASLRSGLALLRTAQRAIDTRSAAVATTRQEQDLGALTIDQLAALGRNVKLERARGYRWQALCYPAASPDWANALGLAIELLQPLTGETEEKDAVTQQAQQELTICRDLYKQKQSGIREASSPPADRKLPKTVAPLSEPPTVVRSTSTKAPQAGRPPAKRDAGSNQRTLEELQQLAAAHPADGNLQEQYAKRLTHTPDRLRDAYVLWSRIEQRSKTASLRWRRARKERIELLEKLGKAEQAEQLRKLTALLYPAAAAAAAPSQAKTGDP